MIRAETLNMYGNSHGPALYLLRFCRSKALTFRAFKVTFSAD